MQITVALLQMTSRENDMASSSIINYCVSILRTYFQKPLFKHGKMVPCMSQKVCKHAAKR